MHYTILLIFLALAGNIQLHSQPLWSGKQTVAELALFPDLKKETLFYYAPNDLQLARESNGAPRFQLIQLRYTGTGITGDQGESRFLNLVQLTVAMPPVSNDQLQKVRKVIALPGIQLRPLPIRHTEGYLLTALGAEYRRLGESGSFQSDSSGGTTTKTSYWTERTFTLRLSNTDAQILWEQVEKGQLALSVNYAFHADMVTDDTKAVQLDADSVFLEQLGDHPDLFPVPDSLPVSRLVKWNTFVVDIDLATWPHVLKKIDVNQQQRVAYPLLEVHCYDFTHEQRPDLGAKTIELEAINVSGRRQRLSKYRFQASRPGQNVFQVQVPFAVRLDRPLRYRVTEWSREGEQQTSAWISRDSWTDVIDITTRTANLPYRQRRIVLETETQSFAAAGIERLSLLISYQYKGKPRWERMDFLAVETIPLKQYTLLQDKNTPVEVLATWWLETGGRRRVKPLSLALDDYAFFPVPAP